MSLEVKTSSSPSASPQIPAFVGEGDWKTEVISPIGSGTFGVIYAGKTVLNGTSVAVKFEDARSTQPQLNFERKVYRMLKFKEGFPQIFWFGCENGFNILIMEMLGPSLEELFETCSHKFSLKTVLMLVEQMLLRIEALHERGYIHRDIKSDNFLMGPNNAKKNKMYLIDFGLAKMYRSPRTRYHVPLVEGRSLIGTARYASVNAHLGIAQSRRDDLEAIGNVVIYFMKGTLPWQNLSAATKSQKYQKIKEKKLSTTVEDLCSGLPHEFYSYMKYCRGMKYEENPDYIKLRGLFRGLFKKNGYFLDYVYDWDLLNQTPMECGEPGREAQGQATAPSETPPRKTCFPFC